MDRMAEPLRNNDAMDVDPAPAPPSPQKQKENSPPLAAENTNGVNGNSQPDKMDVDQEEVPYAPIPPPHRSGTTTPIEPAKPTPEEAEAFKVEGNGFYKNKEYGKAISMYTKGMS